MRLVLFYALVIALACLSTYIWWLDRKLDALQIPPWRPRVMARQVLPWRWFFEDFQPEAIPVLRRIWIAFCGFWLCAVLLVIVSVRAV